MGIGLDYVCMICCMNDTRWLYKSVDFGYGAYLSLSRAAGHFDRAAEDVKMPGPPIHAFHPSRRSPLSPHDRERHAAFVFGTPHHVTGFARTQLPFLVGTMTSKNQPRLSTLDMALIAPSNKQEHRQKSDALMETVCTFKHDSCKRHKSHRCYTTPLSVYPYAVVHSSKSCLDLTIYI